MAGIGADGRQGNGAMVRSAALLRSFSGLIGAALLTHFAPCAMAASTPSARLVTCGDASCLLVSGHRADAGAEVRINGRAVPVEGARTWKAVLPLETVRAWSAPMARSIDVAVIDADNAQGRAQRTDLPIGLLGHVTELATLVVRDR